ncbi:tetratricopeptide repeat protein [Cereibacter changlensis]|uniref:tetratricopeptide repeat protein n=1 Tax=Cereibacter changlensis TaxID=402884 RepID=UPI004033D6D6
MSLEPSNYAFCCALQGDMEKAKALLEAAEFIGAKRKTSIVIFNRSLVCWVAGDLAGAASLMRDFKGKDPKNFAFYSSSSQYMEKFMKDVSAAGHPV